MTPTTEKLAVLARRCYIKSQLGSLYLAHKYVGLLNTYIEDCFYLAALHLSPLYFVGFASNKPNLKNRIFNPITTPSSFSASQPTAYHQTEITAVWKQGLHYLRFPSTA